MYCRSAKSVFSRTNKRTQIPRHRFSSSDLQVGERNKTIYNVSMVNLADINRHTIRSNTTVAVQNQQMMRESAIIGNMNDSVCLHRALYSGRNLNRVSLRPFFKPKIFELYFCYGPKYPLCIKHGLM